jgi:hypothetical protein
MPTDKQLINGWKADFFLFEKNSDYYQQNYKEEILGEIEQIDGELCVNFNLIKT